VVWGRPRMVAKGSGVLAGELDRRWLRGQGGLRRPTGLGPARTTGFRRVDAARQSAARGCGIMKIMKTTSWRAGAQIALWHTMLLIDNDLDLSGRDFGRPNLTSSRLFEASSRRFEVSSWRCDPRFGCPAVRIDDSTFRSGRSKDRVSYSKPRVDDSRSRVDDSKPRIDDSRWGVAGPNLGQAASRLGPVCQIDCS